MSPDGTRIAYPGLWSVPVAGGEPTLVRRAATFGDHSPDGTQLAFVEDGWFGDLLVAPAAGGEAQMLATGETVVPRWSLDGTRIAYNDGLGGWVGGVFSELPDHTEYTSTRVAPTG